jgi:hypothetical protein
MLSEVVLIFILSCGVPQMVIGWGGEVEPFRGPVGAVDGGILIPTELRFDYEYVASHPDLVQAFIETVHPAMAPLVCAERTNA